jgi:hypothetical protein
MFQEAVQLRTVHCSAIFDASFSDRKRVDETSSTHSSLVGFCSQAELHRGILIINNIHLFKVHCLYTNLDVVSTVGDPLLNSNSTDSQLEAPAPSSSSHT